MKTIVLVLVGFVSAFAGLDFGRVWLSIAASFVIVGIGYVFIFPHDLPYWPGAVIVGLGAILGLVWEQKANERMSISSNLKMNRDAKKRPLS